MISIGCLRVLNVQPAVEAGKRSRNPIYNLKDSVWIHIYVCFAIAAIGICERKHITCSTFPTSVHSN